MADNPLATIGTAILTIEGHAVVIGEITGSIGGGGGEELRITSGETQTASGSYSSITVEETGTLEVEDGSGFELTEA